MPPELDHAVPLQLNLQAFHRIEGFRTSPTDIGFPW